MIELVSILCTYQTECVNANPNIYPESRIPRYNQQVNAIRRY